MSSSSGLTAAFSFFSFLGGREKRVNTPERGVLSALLGADPPAPPFVAPATLPPAPGTGFGKGPGAAAEAPSASLSALTEPGDPHDGGGMRSGRTPGGRAPGGEAQPPMHASAQGGPERSAARAASRLRSDRVWRGRRPVTVSAERRTQRAYGCSMRLAMHAYAAILGSRQSSPLQVVEQAGSSLT